MKSYDARATCDALDRAIIRDGNPSLLAVARMLGVDRRSFYRWRSDGFPELVAAGIAVGQWLDGALRAVREGKGHPWGLMPATGSRDEELWRAFVAWRDAEIDALDARARALDARQKEIEERERAVRMREEMARRGAAETSEATAVTRRSVENLPDPPLPPLTEDIKAINIPPMVLRIQRSLSDRKPHKGKTVPTYLHIPEEEAEFLNQRSRAEFCSKSELVRALLAGLREAEKQPAAS